MHYIFSTVNWLNHQQNWSQAQVFKARVKEMQANKFSVSIYERCYIKNIQPQRSGDKHSRTPNSAFCTLHYKQNVYSIKFPWETYFLNLIFWKKYRFMKKVHTFRTWYFENSTDLWIRNNGETNQIKSENILSCLRT